MQVIKHADKWLLLHGGLLIDVNKPIRFNIFFLRSIWTEINGRAVRNYLLLQYVHLQFIKLQIFTSHFTHKSCRIVEEDVSRIVRKDTNLFVEEASLPQFPRKFHGIFLIGYFCRCCTAMLLPLFLVPFCKSSRFNSPSPPLEFSFSSPLPSSLLPSFITILRWVRFYLHLLFFKSFTIYILCQNISSFSLNIHYYCCYGHLLPFDLHKVEFLFLLKREGCD